MELGGGVGRGSGAPSRSAVVWLCADRWLVEGPVRGWRISVGVPATAYVFMARLRTVPANRESGTMQLPVKAAPDGGLDRRWVLCKNEGSTL